MNMYVLYDMIKQLRTYTETIADLSHAGKVNMNSSDWESCMSDVVSALIIIEQYAKRGRDMNDHD